MNLHTKFQKKSFVKYEISIENVKIMLYSKELANEVPALKIPYIRMKLKMARMTCDFKKCLEIPPEPVLDEIRFLKKIEHYIVTDNVFT